MRHLLTYFSGWKILLTSLVLILVSGLDQAVRSDDITKAMMDLAAKPIRITNNEAIVFTGFPEKVDDRSITLRSQVDRGQVYHIIKKESFKSAYFPGEELFNVAIDYMNEGNYGIAESLLQSLYDKRAPFFSYLDEPSVFQFNLLVSCYLEQNKSIEAIGVANQLLQYTQSDQRRRTIRTSLLLANFQLNLKEETTVLADQWISEEKERIDNALGWWIKGLLLYEQEDFESALMNSLYPVIFSKSSDIDYLAECYVLAVSCADQLKDEKHVRQLLKELETRQIEWPAGLEKKYPTCRFFEFHEQQE